MTETVQPVFKDHYTFRPTGDDKRVWTWMIQKWPNLMDPETGEVDAIALDRELRRDWEQYDNLYRGKSALQIYEAALTRRFVQAMAEKAGVNVDEVLSDFTFDKWADEYHAKKREFDLLSESSGG